MSHNEHGQLSSNADYPSWTNIEGSKVPLEEWYSDWSDLKDQLCISRTWFLPIYLLIDTSHDALKTRLGSVLARFKMEMASSILQMVYWIWIIPFGETAPVLFPRQDGSLHFDWPQLRLGGRRRLDLALSALRKSIETDIPDDRQARAYKPLVFAFLGGYPEDEHGRRTESWREGIEQLRGLRYYHRPHIYSFAYQADVDRDFLKTVGTEGAFYLSEFTGSFSGLLQYFRDDVEVISDIDGGFDPFGSFSPGPDGLVKIP